MELIISILFWSLWRRDFGTSQSNFSRGILCVFCVLVIAVHFITDYSDWISIAYGLALGIWVYAEYWSLPVGAGLDCGRNKNPDIESYKKILGYDFLLKVFPTEKHHGKLFDFCLNLIRYAIPMTIFALATWNPMWILAGILPAALYELSWRVYEWKPKFFRFKCLQYPNHLAEFLTGAQFGVFMGIGAVA